jgi:hypothetical protein
MEILLYIILIYLIFRLFFRLIVRYLLHRSRKAAEKEGYVGQDTDKQKKKKVFKKDDGEYVDFEEMDHT